MKRLLLGALLLLSTLSFSQPRTNEVLPTFIETSNSFVNTTEYEYSSYSGKWIERKNENDYFFRKIEFKTIEFNSEKFYILIIHERQGAYKYPSIKEGFYTWKSLRAYIYTKEQYKLIKNYESVSSNYNEVILNDDILENGYKNIELSIINSIKNNRNAYYKILFKIKKEDENTIRFILPIKNENKILEKSYGFDKRYFESKRLDFDQLFNLE